VAAVLRRTYRDFSADGYPKLVGAFAPGFEYRFVGEHAMGGVRRQHDTMTAWFERIFRLMPDLSFTVRDVFVAGGPWRMRIAVFGEVSSAARGYRNMIVQSIEMRWGKITRMVTWEDTQKLVRELERLAAEGHPEAVAAPLTDEPDEPDESDEPAPVSRPGAP
jgi:ketosteroid isomerase-like protein